MMTLQQFSAKLENLPASTAWYLADLSEARGKQELFTRQTTQRLKRQYSLKGVNKEGTEIFWEQFPKVGISHFEQLR